MSRRDDGRGAADRAWCRWIDGVFRSRESGHVGSVVRSLGWISAFVISLDKV